MPSRGVTRSEADVDTFWACLLEFRATFTTPSAKNCERKAILDLLFKQRTLSRVVVPWSLTWKAHVKVEVLRCRNADLRKLATIKLSTSGFGLAGALLHMWVRLNVL